MPESSPNDMFGIPLSSPHPQGKTDSWVEYSWNARSWANTGKEHGYFPLLFFQRWDECRVHVDIARLEQLTHAVQISSWALFSSLHPPGTRTQGMWNGAKIRQRSFPSLLSRNQASVTVHLVIHTSSNLSGSSIFPSHLHTLTPSHLQPLPILCGIRGMNPGHSVM